MDFESIEGALGVVLPPEYKRFLNDPPFADKGKYANVYNSLLDNPQEIIDLNLILRRRGYARKKWPESFLAIGQLMDDDGRSIFGLFFLDCDDDSDFVYSTMKRVGPFTPDDKKRMLAYDSLYRFVEWQRGLQEICDMGE